jgi:hypothetical protein
VTINRLRGEVMDKITTVGLDLAKQVMAVHAVDSDGRMVTRKVVRRDQLLRWMATLPGAWWRWKRAVGRTIGRGN